MERERKHRRSSGGGGGGGRTADAAAPFGRGLRSIAPAGFLARRFLAGDDELVVASFPLPAPLRGPPGPALTAAEREVAAALIEGRSYADIARRRRRSVNTVAKQASSAFRKLGVSSRAELAARGILPTRDQDDGGTSL